MSQGLYYPLTRHTVRALPGAIAVSFDPSVQATEGKRGQLAVQLGTLDIWQKQDDGVTTNWILLLSAVSPSGPAGGELTGTYPNPSLSNAAVIAKVLTGLVLNFGEVLSTDTILQAIEKLSGNSSLTPLEIDRDVTIPSGWAWNRPTRTAIVGTTAVTVLGEMIVT